MSLEAVPCLGLKECGLKVDVLVSGSGSPWRVARTSATVNFSVVVGPAGGAPVVVVSFTVSTGLDLLGAEGLVRVTVWLGLVDRSTGLSGLTLLRLLGARLLMTTGFEVVVSGALNLEFCLCLKGVFNFCCTEAGVVDFSSFSTVFFSTTASSRSLP